MNHCTIKLLFLLIGFVFPATSYSHYCPALTKNELSSLHATLDAIEIERTELPYSAHYKITAPLSVDNNRIKMVYFRSGFGSHPEVNLQLHFEVSESNQISFEVASVSPGFKGCIDLYYVKNCGILPQVTLTYEKAGPNLNINNTVYCGYNPT